MSIFSFKHLLFSVSCISLMTSLTIGQTTQEIEKFRKLLDAIRYVETRNLDRPPDGDNGRSVGPYQISHAYWTDANLPDGKYTDCRDQGYSERVIIQYWKRYAAQAMRLNDYETLARIHNGGPSGRNKQATEKYWQKVKQALDRMSSVKMKRLHLFRPDLIPYPIIADIYT